MYSWPFTFVIATALFPFCLFVLLVYFLTNIHGTVAGVGVLLAVTLYLVCPTGVVAGVSVSLDTHVFVLLFFSLTWENSKSRCALGCPSFLLSHLFFVHLPGTVARVGMPLAVHHFF